MNTLRGVSFWSCLVVNAFGFPAAALHAASPASAARATVERGVRAQGGWTAVERQKVAHVKVSGRSPGPGGVSVPVILEDYWSWPKYRTQSTVALSGKSFVRTMGITPNSGWITASGRSVIMSVAALKEMQEEIYEESIDKLFPLRNPRFRLSPAGSIQVGGRDATGVRVSSVGHRDVLLYFDVDSGLLVKRSDHILDDTGHDTLREVYFGKYKKIGGITVPGRVAASYDSKEQFSGDVTRMEFPASLDEKLFEAP